MSQTLLPLLTVSTAFQRKAGLRAAFEYGHQRASPSAIKYQQAIIQRHKDHGFARHAADSARIASEIAASYRTISCLLDTFQVSSVYGT
jgi:hypothetical protein